MIYFFSPLMRSFWGSLRLFSFAFILSISSLRADNDSTPLEKEDSLTAEASLPQSSEAQITPDLLKMDDEKDQIILWMTEALENDPKTLKTFLKNISYCEKKRTFKKSVHKVLKGALDEKKEKKEPYQISTKWKPLFRQVLRARDKFEQNQVLPAVEGMDEALREYGSLEELRKMAGLTPPPSRAPLWERFKWNSGYYYQEWKPVVIKYLWKKVDAAIIGAFMGAFQERTSIRQLIIGVEEETTRKVQTLLKKSTLEPKEPENFLKTLTWCHIFQSSLEGVLQSILSDVATVLYTAIQKTIGVSLKVQKEDRLFLSQISNSLTYKAITGEYQWYPFSSSEEPSSHFFFLNKNAKWKEFSDYFFARQKKRIYALSWSSIGWDIVFHLTLKSALIGIHKLMGKKKRKSPVDTYFPKTS